MGLAVPATIPDVARVPPGSGESSTAQLAAPFIFKRAPEAGGAASRWGEGRSFWTGNTRGLPFPNLILPAYHGAHLSLGEDTANVYFSIFQQNTTSRLPRTVIVPRTSLPETLSEKTA